jgi:hypothetical protein
MSQRVSVFISWSGDPAHIVAKALSKFINNCIQVTDPWVSDSIEKGTVWSEAILSKLQSAAVGIACVTKRNQIAPWLLFESGALAKNKVLHVLRIEDHAKPTDIAQPLGFYQQTAAEKDELFDLLCTIDDKLSSEDRRGREKLREDCERNWPDLEAAIKKARAHPDQPAQRREPQDLLEEILTTVRALAEAGIQAGRTSGQSAIRALALQVLASKVRTGHRSPLWSSHKFADALSWQSEPSDQELAMLALEVLEGGVPGARPKSDDPKDEQ